MSSIIQSLCEQARAGDRSAYEQLFHLHFERAILFIRARLGRHLRTSIDTQDVLQEAFLAAHRQFDAFRCDGEHAFLRWLCRIIENRIRDWNDRQHAAKRQPVEIPQSSPTGPITALDRRAQRTQLLAAIDSLTEDHRQVILLKYFEGLTSDEVGQRLGRTPGAARKLLARALTELGRRLKSPAIEQR